MCVSSSKYTCGTTRNLVDGFSPNFTCENFSKIPLETQVLLNSETNKGFFT